MQSSRRFLALFAATGEAVGPGLAHDERRRAGERVGSGLADTIAGALARFALAAEMWTWSRANAAPMENWTEWGAWIRPEPGLIEAVGAWIPAVADATMAALMLATMQIGAVMLAVGFLTRIGGALVVILSCVFMLQILPEAWTTASVYAALGAYLMLRGPGMVSLDWSMGRLARFK
ncbi:MAG: hypothetical protein AAFX09_05425 [Pseudomonadota bacterium]